MVVIAEYRVDAVPRLEFCELSTPFIDVAGIEIEDVASDHDEIGREPVDAANEARETIWTEQRADVQICDVYHVEASDMRREARQGQ